MQDYDWIVVPSRWWENSPMVIQEAFSSHKPVICSDIGGMAEKVRHQIDGLHFRAGKASSLSQTLSQAAHNQELFQELQHNIKTPPSHLESAEAHHQIYTGLYSTTPQKPQK
jgi:glycosyltransferase involved in cell wall biosynthesis